MRSIQRKRERGVDQLVPRPLIIIVECRRTDRISGKGSCKEASALRLVKDSKVVRENIAVMYNARINAKTRVLR